MFFTRSVLASATLLSFSATTKGWVLHRTTEEHADVKRVAAEPAQGGWSWSSFFGKRQGDVVLDCPDSPFADLLDSNPSDRVKNFCNDWLNIPPSTVVSEITPTVTVTTSDSTTTTQTTTERVMTTTTVFETTTVAATASVRRRLAATAAAQVESIASSIVESVMASGTPISSVPAASKAANRLLAEQGLATACSCKLVEPTATVTEYYTVPAVTTTVGVRVIRVVQQTDVRTFTQTISVLDGVTPVTASPASSSTEAVSSSAATGNSSGTEVVGSSSAPSSDADGPSSSPAITSAPVSPTSIFSGNSTSTSIEGVPVVTAIPFSCNEDDISKNIDQVVGGIRLGYSVYCNTGLVTADRIGRPINVESATSCAAQCSLVNARSGQDTCQSAQFVPYTDGRRGGTCDLFSSEESSNVETVPVPGSVAIVHTGTFSNGDECAALNATSVSIDTSALVASITSAGVVISTPGLVTQTSDSGVFRTYVSANSTDAQGYVHWSWYEVYASSMSWWAVYQTSWACSATITRTIAQQATTIVEGTTVTSVAVTTIIINGFTTIISGGVTRTIGGGGGVAGPTFVPASTTGGEAGVTTFFSATQTSTGDDGIVTPAPSASTLGGEGNVTVVNVFTTYFSTQDAGVIPPSASASLDASISAPVGVDTVVSSGAATFTVLSSNVTFLSTGTDGIITPSVSPVVETIESSGEAVFTISGSNATFTSIGDSGLIPPPPSASASPVVETIESSGETVFTISGSNVTFTSTGDSGSILPPPSASASPVVETIESSGETVFTISGSNATFTSTGDNGVIPPFASASPVVETVVVSSGEAIFTISGSNATSTSTGDSGLIPPPPSASSYPETIVSSGEAAFTIGGSNATFTSTGDSGLIPPPPSASVSVSENSAVVSPGATTDTDEWDNEGPYGPKTSTRVVVSSELFTITSTGLSGVETPTVITALSSETVIVVVSNTTIAGNASIEVFASTATFNSTGGNGIVTPTVVTEVITTAVGTANFTTTAITATLNSTGAEGIIPPPSIPMVTETADLTSSVPTPGVTGITIEEFGNFTATFGTGITASTEASGVIPPVSINSTLATPSTTGPPFTNSEAGRNGYSLSHPTSSGNATSASGSIIPSSNLTIAAETPSTNTTLVLTVPLSTGFTTTIEVPFLNSSQPITPSPSSTATPTSNITSSFPQETGDRTGRFSTTSSTPTGNITSSIPQETGDRTGRFSTTSSVPVNTTLTLTVPLSTGPMILEVPVVNSTIPVPQITPPVEIPPVSVNSTPSLPVAPPFVVQSASTLIVTTTTNITLLVPTGNATLVTLIPPTTRPFDNTTAPLPTPAGSSTTESLVSINYTTVPMFSVGNLSTILPPATPTGNTTIASETPSISMNSTAVPPSVTIPPVPANSTLPVQNTTTVTPFTNSEAPRTGSFGESSVPLFTAETAFLNVTTTSAPFPTDNSTIPTGPTAVPPSVTTPPVPANSTLPVQNATTVTPFTNSEAPRTGSFGESSVPLFTAETAFSNVTTTPPPFPTGNSTIPAGPTAPVNSTTEACPIATEFSFITREVIITTFTVETVPVVPSTCISSGAEPTGLNGTFSIAGNATLPVDTIPLTSAIESLASASVPTSSDLAPVVSDILSVISEVTASATDVPVAATVNLFRRSGELATADQIAAACADTSNLIQAPAFNIQPNSDTEGWFVAGSEDPTITVSSVDTGNGTDAQFRSAFPGRTASITQPLVLCPGTQYELSAFTRQASTASRCTVTFTVGNDIVFTASPQRYWVDRTERFTAGAGPEGASVDLNIQGSCAGFFGAPVGADADGYMVVDVGPVSVTAVSQK